MPVEAHAHMLGAQYLASALRPSHISHGPVTADPGPRLKKDTLSTKYADTVAPFLVNGIMQEHDYGNARKSIHTNAVRQTVNYLGPNPLLGA